jgi:hypothetical protein
VGHVISMVMNLAGASLMANRPMPNQPPWLNMMSGTVGVATAILGILLAALILIGALKMKKLESYGFAMTASIVAMLPCSLCCLFGLPIGIWALVVLSKPEVKSAFH